MSSVAEGGIKTTEELASFARRAAIQIGGLSDHKPVPRPASARRDVERMKQALSDFRGTDREVLTRFYEGDSVETICCDSMIRPSKFNMIRSRLKTRSLELGCASLQEPGAGLAQGSRFSAAVLRE